MNDEYEDEYDELDYRADDQYWISDRTLVVEDIQVNHKATTSSKRAEVPQENQFALKKLQT